MSAALRVVKATKRFGGVAAISDVTLEVLDGSLTALIGPNGAGKTTLFNLVTNLFPPTAGEIFFYDTCLNPLSPGQIAARGLIRTFQTARVFPAMTVLENVLVGGHRHIRRHAGEQMLWLASARREERELTARADAFLDLAGLARWSTTCRSSWGWPIRCWSSMPALLSRRARPTRSGRMPA
jgi:branched-chain amino acid transport system ATP-binding protein